MFGQGRAGARGGRASVVAGHGGHEVRGSRDKRPTAFLVYSTPQQREPVVVAGAGDRSWSRKARVRGLRVVCAVALGGRGWREEVGESEVVP